MNIYLHLISFEQTEIYEIMYNHVYIFTHIYMFYSYYKCIPRCLQNFDAVGRETPLPVGVYDLVCMTIIGKYI